MIFSSYEIPEIAWEKLNPSMTDKKVTINVVKNIGNKR